MLKNMKKCIFCNIVEKKSPANILFEDEVCMVIETTSPVSKGHVLVIPKQHFENILDIEDSILAHLIIVSKNIGKLLISEHDAAGMNLLHAAGNDAQQSVFHFHFHVVPRYKNDRLDLWFRNKL